MIEKKIEKNDITIALNALYAIKDKMYPAYVLKHYVLKHNSNHEKQFILLIIPNGEGYNYLPVKICSALLRGVTSKHHGNFYCLNCLHSFRTECKLKLCKKLCENKYFCCVVMASVDTEILKFNQYQKFDKAPFIF